MSTVSDLLIKIGADSSGLTKELNKSKQSLDQTFKTDVFNQFNAAMDDTGNKITGLISRFNQFAALAATGFGLTKIIQSAVEAGDSIHDLSERMRISYGEASQLSRILNLTGNDSGTFASAFMRLDKTLTSGEKSAAKALNTLDAVGVSLQDSSGKLLPLNEQLKNLAEGYRRATEAGYGQEFIMNTLGVKGLALEKTLRDYNEAAANASRIQSIGLDPQQMHEISEELKVMQMQGTQLSYIVASILLPVAQEIIPYVISGLGEVSSLMAHHREEVSETVKTVTGLYIAYKALQEINSLGNMAQGLLGNTAESVAATAQISALTATQEAAIEKRIAAIERSGQREIATYLRSAEYLALSEEEKVNTVALRCAQIETRNAEMAAKIRAEMTAAYASMTVEGVEANTAVAASAEAKGVAEANAGVKAVEANTASAISAQGVTAANVGVAASAATAGTTAIASAASTSGAVTSLTSIVWNLAGGWMGVAAAIIYATGRLIAFQYQEEKKKARNTYEIEGHTYYKEEDGKIYENPQGFTEEGSGLDYQTYTDIVKGTRKEVTDPSVIGDVNARDNSRHREEMTDAEKAIEDAKNAAHLDIENIQKKMGDIQSSTDKTTGAVKSAETAIKTVQVQVPIGEALYDEATKYIGTPYQLGGAGADGGWTSTDCGKLVKDVSDILGICIGGNRTVDKIAEYADSKGALIPYMPGVAKKGDLITMDNGSHDPTSHIGISNGEGGYIAANSSTGVAEHSDFSGFTPTGIIRMDVLTGGATVTRTLDANGKKLAETRNKVNQLKDSYISLYDSMNQSILGINGNQYESDMAKAEKDIEDKKKQISKMAAGGLDVNPLNSKLKEYADAIKSQVTDKWAQRLREFKVENANILAEVNGDYVNAANVEYESTVEGLKKQRTEKLNSISKYQDDMEAQKQVDDWYNNSVLKAALDKDKKIKESHDRLMQQLAERGDVQGVANELNNNPQAGISSQQFSGQQKLAQAYVDLWNEAHISIEENLANASKNMYETLSSSVADFIRGTKSAMDVVHDFGNLVLDTIAQIVAKKFAANMVSGLLGSIMGGGGGGAGSITFAGSDTAYNLLTSARPFASGGIVTAPTLGLIAEAGKSEAVMPLDMLGSMINSKGGGVQVNITNNKSDADVKVTSAKYDEGLNKTILSIVINGAAQNTDNFGGNLKAALLGG